MRSKHNVKILFVCLGNIIRSPLLHYLLQKRVEEVGLSDKVEIDSCAVSGWNIGDDMDPRIRASAEKEGMTFQKHKAKLFRKEMLKHYDYVFVVTKELVEKLQKSASSEEQKKILLATHLSSTYAGKDIPDPYYGGEELFDEVFSMIHTVVDEILLELKKMFP